MSIFNLNDIPKDQTVTIKDLLDSGNEIKRLIAPLEQDADKISDLLVIAVKDGQIYFSNTTMPACKAVIILHHVIDQLTDKSGVRLA